MNWIGKLLSRLRPGRKDDAPPPEPVSNDEVPDTIGQYRIIQPLGEGGMGQVYLVEGEDGQRHALKIVLADVEEPNFYDRFHREIGIGMQLRHPNVCQVQGWGISDQGRLYLVMELLVGEDLEALLRRAAPLGVAQSIHIVRQLLVGLEAIHQAGIVHRDSKPANIYLCSDGVLKLMDFGIARQEGAQRLTATGASLGTPDFLAPEQFEDVKRADARCDLFAVGLLFYEMLTGHGAFEAPNVDDTIVRLLEGDRTPISQYRTDLSPELLAWLDMLLALRPEDRFNSAAAALQALPS